MTTVGSLWQALHRVYSVVSSAKIMELHRLLQTTTREGQGCNDYFEQMRNIVDQLAAVGEPVNNSNLICYVLKGLGSELTPLLLPSPLGLILFLLKNSMAFSSLMSLFFYLSIKSLLLNL
jgi:gag-polypeptide of LTR copia-type